MKKRALTETEQREWANTVHLLTLNALMQDSAFKNKSLAFHGGTSLHLAWNSPRFSEDLDFLISKDLGSQIDRVMQRVHRRVEEQLLAVDPDFTLEIKKRQGGRDRLDNFYLKVSRPGVLGKAMVKVELWQVEPQYLEHYETVFRTPVQKDDLIANVAPETLPAATLESAFCDKMVAFATRPQLKWRDVFDVWWMANNAQFTVPPMADLARRFVFHLSEYRTLEDLPPSQALERFADQLEASAGPQAERDLKTWLPDTLWERLYPEQMPALMETPARLARTLAAAVREQGLDEVYDPDAPAMTQAALYGDIDVPPGP